MDHKNHSCLIIDNGLFVELAATLAKSFGKVYYYSPWESAFPKSNSTLIGKGLPGVTRIDDFWSILDEVDLFCFPDVYFGSLQLHLEDLGKRVWGSRKGEELELFRDESKKHLEELGINVGHYEVVKGIDQLRKYLKTHEDQWVKISTTRGDFESFHSKNYKLIEPRLDELEHILGAKKKITEFIVEDNIEDAIEIGYDSWTIDGKFPATAMYGIEIKDKAYIGRFDDYQRLPIQIKDVNTKLSPTLKNYGYRNFLTAEMRITIDDHKPWIIDPCTRAGSPPSELSLIMVKNLADVIWEGAVGECLDPEPVQKYGAELLIHSAWADKNWQAIQFPDEIRDHVKLRNLSVLDGEYYVIPQSVGLPEIGAVVATGDTIEEAIEEVQTYAKQVEGYYIDIFPDALNEAEKEIEKLRSIGINF